MEENTTPAIKELQEHLGTKARIQATDGRVFTGVFMCIDKYRNVVLTGAEEFREGADGREERRYVGMIMVPGKHCVSMGVEHFV